MPDRILVRYGAIARRVHGLLELPAPDASALADADRAAIVRLLEDGLDRLGPIHAALAPPACIDLPQRLAALQHELAALGLSEDE